jgi:NADH dehydrogenase
MTRPQVVIVGGGFGGLSAATALARAPVDITLIDRRNHHLFQPLLYQVATAALNASDIAYPIRGALAKQRNVRVLLAEARAVDVATRTVALDAGELHYDFLIVAAGATHSYFGHEAAWAAHAPGLKSIEDALEIRRRIFLAYEAAERESDPDARRAWLTFVVVGGGPTGVELAGALGEIGLHTLAKDFRSIDPTAVRVVLCEGNARVLGTYPEKLSFAAQHALAGRHVDVRVRTMVTAIDDCGVGVRGPGGDERIAARTVLWAAGVQASPLGASLGAQRDREGRVIVNADLSLPEHPEVFVIGDLAHVDNLPGVSQVALQGGRHVARIIAREASTSRAAASARPVFRYHDKGNMATIGRADAVIATKHFAKSGFWAWMLWWAVHIYFLIGFRNRALVFAHWAWSWLTYKRGARLITGKVGALPPVTEPTAPASPPTSTPASPEHR